MSKLMIKGQQASGTYGNASDIKINEISGMTASNAQEALVALNNSLSTLEPLAPQIGNITALNDTTIQNGFACKMGYIKCAKGSFICKSGTTLNASTPLARLPYGASTYAIKLPCVYRNTASGATIVSSVAIATTGEIYPDTTNGSYNEIRLNVTYI